MIVILSNYHLHYTTWFKFHFPNIYIKTSPNGQYIMEIYRSMQGTKPAGSQLNTILHLVLSSLGLVNHIINHSLYIFHHKSENGFLVVRFYVDYFLCYEYIPKLL